MQAAHGRLAAALDRVQQLETELAAFKASAAEAISLEQSDLVGRLTLVAPAIKVGIAKSQGKVGEALAPLSAARRNAAAHCFDAPAARIAQMSQRALNRLQRGARRTSRQCRRRHRQAPAQLSAAERVPTTWTTCWRKRARSTPCTMRARPGVLFDLAERRWLPPMRPAQLASGPLWFNAENEELAEGHNVPADKEAGDTENEERAVVGAADPPPGVPSAARDDDDVILEEFRRRAQAEEEELLCGDGRAREVAKAALQRHLQKGQIACPEGHSLVTTTLVRHLCCDGPACGGKSGEQALAFVQCVQCNVNLCLYCISKLQGWR